MKTCPTCGALPCDQILSRDIIQECIDAITAEGVRVREGSNESWRGGMFHAGKVLENMKEK